MTNDDVTNPGRRRNAFNSWTLSAITCALLSAGCSSDGGANTRSNTGSSGGEGPGSLSGGSTGSDTTLTDTSGSGGAEGGGTDGGCLSNQTECSAECVNLRSDPDHCGACEQACGEGEFCSAGACVAACPGAGAVFAELTDPSCSDGKYCEVLPDLEADIGGLIDELEQQTEFSEISRLSLEILDLGYPFGSKLIRTAGMERYEYWIGRAFVTWKAGLGFSVHECGHDWDLRSDGPWTYNISEGYSLLHPEEDYFSRSEITGDAYHSTIPDAAANDTYFDEGSVTGGLGIRTMYDEWAQYNHDLPVDILLYSHPSTRQDFYVKYALNFAWAAPRYLLWAKNNHPDDFADMMADADLREATLVLWGQTMLYYDVFASLDDWEPSQEETQYLDAIRHPDLLGIMNDLRVAHGCDGL